MMKIEATHMTLLLALVTGLVLIEAASCGDVGNGVDQVPRSSKTVSVGLAVNMCKRIRANISTSPYGLGLRNGNTWPEVGSKCWGHAPEEERGMRIRAQVPKLLQHHLGKCEQYAQNVRNSVRTGVREKKGWFRLYLT
jgi:hypothetical protein